jgi:hypothetical protein
LLPYLPTPSLVSTATQPPLFSTARLNLLKSQPSSERQLEEAGPVPPPQSATLCPQHRPLSAPVSASCRAASNPPRANPPAPPFLVHSPPLRMPASSTSMGSRIFRRRKTLADDSMLETSPAMDVGEAVGRIWDSFPSGATLVATG